ncbi:hypothetical protein R6Z07M_011015 [Ovis aries]
MRKLRLSETKPFHERTSRRVWGEVAAGFRCMTPLQSREQWQTQHQDLLPPRVFTSSLISSPGRRWHRSRLIAQPTGAGWGLGISVLIALQPPVTQAENPEEGNTCSPFLGMGCAFPKTQKARAEVRSRGEPRPEEKEVLDEASASTTGDQVCWEGLRDEVTENRPRPRPLPASSAPPPSPPRPPEPLSGGGGPRTGFPQTRGRVEEEAAEPRILLRRRRAPPATTARPRRLLGLTEPRRGNGRGGCVEAAGARAEAARPAAAAALLCGPGQGKRSGRRGELGVPLPPRLMATTLGTSGTLRPWRPRRRLLGPQPRPLW